MRKIFIVSCVLLLLQTVATAESSCKPSDKKCTSKIVEGGLAAEKIMRGAVEEIIMILEDPIMKRTMKNQLAECDAIGQKPTAGAEELNEENQEHSMTKSKIQCYQEILSNQLIVDMLPQAIGDSVQNFFIKGGKI